MQNDFQYDIFLSFASKEQDIVKTIWEKLSNSSSFAPLTAIALYFFNLSAFDI